MTAGVISTERLIPAMLLLLALFYGHWLLLVCVNKYLFYLFLLYSSKPPREHAELVGWWMGCSMASLFTEGALGKKFEKEGDLNISLMDCRTRHLWIAALCGQATMLWAVNYPSTVMGTSEKFLSNFLTGLTPGCFSESVNHKVLPEIGTSHHK